MFALTQTPETLLPAVVSFMEKTSVHIIPQITLTGYDGMENGIS